MSNQIMAIILHKNKIRKCIFFLDDVRFMLSSNVKSQNNMLVLQ